LIGGGAPEAEGRRRRRADPESRLSKDEIGGGVRLRVWACFKSNNINYLIYSFHYYFMKTCKLNCGKRFKFQA